jgi:hypothetical protein
MTVWKSGENADLHIVTSRLKGAVAEPEEAAISRQRTGKYLGNITK